MGTFRQAVRAMLGGVLAGDRHSLNFIQGSGMTVTVADNAGTDSIDVTLAASAASGVSSFNTRTGAVTLAKADVTGTGLAASDVSALATPSGTAGTGKSPVTDGAGGSAWTDVATQAELDTHAALTTTAHGGIVASSDARLTDSRAPNGSASGDLTGTYPGPTVANNKILPNALKTGSTKGQLHESDGANGWILVRRSAARRFKTGQLYAADGAAAISSVGAASYTLSRLYLVPFETGPDFTFTTVGMSEHTAGVATAVWRVGVYLRGTDGFPTGTPIADWGTLDFSGGAGVKEAAISWTPADDDIYWLGAAPQTAVGNARGWSVPVFEHCPIASATADPCGLGVAAVTGAFGDLTSATFINLTSNVPRVYLKP